MEINFKRVLRKYLDITGIKPGTMARNAGLEKQTIYNYLDNTKATEPNKRTMDALFKAYPDLFILYKQEGAHEISTCNEETAEYKSAPYDDVIHDLKEEIRDLNARLLNKEKLLKLLEECRKAASH